MKETIYDSQKYPNFVKENPATGVLKVQVFSANQAFPLPDVEIDVWKEIDGDKVMFFRGVTDSSGIIDNIILPATVAKKNIDSPGDITYTPYTLTAIYPKTGMKKDYEIGIFDNLKVIQPIRISTIPMMDGDK